MNFLKNNTIIIALTALICPINTSYASTSIIATGYAGATGQYSSKNPASDCAYFAMRVPIGLMLQASPSDRLNLYLGIDYAYNNYPGPSVLLGQTTASAAQNNNLGPNSTNTGQFTPMPFANTINAQNGGTPFSQKHDVPNLSIAYFSYQTDFGVLKAGRMPRNWALGLWYNDAWTPTTGIISTSDAIAFSTELSSFAINLYYEKFGESVGGSSSDQAANAYSIDISLKSDPADVPSSGVLREIGLAYAKFDHAQSNTSLNIIDIYSKFYLANFFAGLEVLYPSGHSQNPNYQSLGGAPACSFTTADANASLAQSCSAQNFSSLAALLRFKLQLSGAQDASLIATETAQQLLGTRDRAESSMLGLWFGYASGGANQFYEAKDAAFASNDNNIKAIFMHPNIQPSFLMFNNTMPAINGMPTGAITNTSFIRLDYTYEMPSWGAIGPVFVWAKLNNTNPNYNSSYPICANPSSANQASSLNRLCVGGNANLGAELDLNYHYTTADHLLAGIDLGYWFVGDAWKAYGQAQPQGVYGMRIFTGREF